MNHVIFRRQLQVSWAYYLYSLAINYNFMKKLYSQLNEQE